MTESIKSQLIEWAETYNNKEYFTEDPIIFPRHFAERIGSGAMLQDVEVAAVFASHFAWGRRSMIVRDCERLFEHMQWKPFEYVMAGDWKDDEKSIHRTIKWSDVAQICSRLQKTYENIGTLEWLSQSDMRTQIFAQKEDPRAANKKINMMRRWMIRNDGKVDLGVWKHSHASDLLIPLDIHVYDQATALGLTSRKQKDITTVHEITDAFKEIFPSDPCKGDFALFGYGITHNNA